MKGRGVILLIICYDFNVGKLYIYDVISFGRNYVVDWLVEFLNKNSEYLYSHDRIYTMVKLVCNFSEYYIESLKGRGVILIIICYDFNVEKSSIYDVISVARNWLVEWKRQIPVYA